jgi:hypothetical protein
MAVFQVTGTATNVDGTTNFTGTINTTAPPVVTSVTVVPQSAPAGTPRTITVVATGTAPITYNLTSPVVQTNTTGVFTVTV